MPNVTVYVVTNWQNLPAQVTPIDATNLNHLETGVKALNDFINTLHAESGLYLCATPFLAEDRTKLDGIDEQANKYVLPTATTGSLGGVKVDGVTITINENGVISSVASSTSLENLTDVDLDNLADGQILKYDSENSKWVNATNEAVTTLANLTDTEITNPSDGQILKYDAETGKWINGTGGGGGSATLAGLDDVDLDTPASGQILRFNGEDWENSDEDILDYEDTINALGIPEPSPIGRGRVVELVYESAGTGQFAPVNVDVSFIKSIADFDVLLVEVQNLGDSGYTHQVFVDLTVLRASDRSGIIYGFYGTRYLLLSKITNTEFKYSSGLTNEQQQFIPYIRKIYGIKY